jgi:hypothetical protein
MNIIMFITHQRVHESMPLLHGSIITNDERMLITIDGKWLEAFVHITKTIFLNLPCLIQIELFISIHTYANFLLLPTSTFIGFHENI